MDIRLPKSPATWQTHSPVANSLNNVHFAGIFHFKRRSDEQFWADGSLHHTMSTNKSHFSVALSVVELAKAPLLYPLPPPPPLPSTLYSLLSTFYFLIPTPYSLLSTLYSLAS